MKKRYRVTGRTSTLGHAPGEVFMADLPREQEARMLDRGSIVRASRRDENSQDESATSSSPSSTTESTEET